MVSFTKEIFVQGAKSKAFPKELDLSSLEETLNNYPAFNSAYLVQAYLLKNQNEKQFERKLPLIAINVKDRAVLHDFIYTQDIEHQVVEEPIVEKIIEEEPVTPIVKEEIPVPEERIILEEEKEVKTPKIEEVVSKEKTIEIEKPILETAEKIVEKTEITSPEVEEEVVSKDIDVKEKKRLQAMQTLQDELFGAKVSADGNIDPKEQRRLDAMKKLQDELFKNKPSKEVSKVVPEKIVEKEILKEVEKIEVKKEPTPQIEKEKVVPVIEKIVEQAIEIKKEEKVIPEEIKIQDKPATSSIIEDLIKRQEEKIKDIIEEENTFEEKDTSLDFIDWLKLKNAATYKAIELKKPTKSIEVKEEKKEEDLVPFERASTIEAEMHKEVKASTDPLENFISAEIIRKKKKKTNQKQVIVSETLAEIFTLQQKYTEALEVYELLSLKYPQKSIYFAHQIEKIKNYL